MSPITSTKTSNFINFYPPMAMATVTQIASGRSQQTAMISSATPIHVSDLTAPMPSYISPYPNVKLASISSPALPDSAIYGLACPLGTQPAGPCPATPVASTHAPHYVNSAAPVDVTSKTIEEQWYAYYAKLINRYWKHIRQEAIDLSILPPDCCKVVHPGDISSTNVADSVVALCHYLVESHQHIHTHYNVSPTLPQCYPVTEWAIPELALLDRAAAEESSSGSDRGPGGDSTTTTTTTTIVLRFWLKDPGSDVRKKRAVRGRRACNELQWDYGCVVPPVPAYWRDVGGGVRANGTGIPEAIKFREMEEEQALREKEEERRAGAPERRERGRREREEVRARLMREWGGASGGMSKEKLRRLRVGKERRKREQVERNERIWTRMGLVGEDVEKRKEGAGDVGR